MKYPISDEYTKLSWDLFIKAPLEKVWDYVSNTNRINQAVGLGEVTYKEIPVEYGGSLLYGITKDAGFTSVYREYPYEWVEGEFVKVHREYSKGLFKNMIFSMEFSPNEEGFWIHFLLAIELKYKFIKPILLFQTKRKIIPSFNLVFQNIEKFYKGNSNQVYHTHSVNNNTAFHEVLNQFNKIDVSSSLKEKLAQFIVNSTDEDLAKIRVKKLANQLKEKYKEVLRFFLQATKLGFFDLNYDILCPSCKGAKSSSKHLFDLNQAVHCSTCNIEYGPEFDKNVEVTFTPNPSLRKIEAKLYCFGGPGTTPHIRAQIRVEPNTKEKIFFYFKSGEYKITSLQTNQTLLISVNDSLAENNKIYYPSEGTIQVPQGKTLVEFENSNSYPIVFRIVRDFFSEEILTAHELTSIQEFRDLFSSEILRPNQEVAIQSLCILFTDLESSTQFYNENGESLAYKIVSEHFEILIQNVYKYDGAVVKTIGDAVMAVFRDPLNALRYAIEIQKDFEGLRKKYPQNYMKLKVGLHIGPVIAVTMNEKLDYFGTNVNLAARTQSEAKGGEVVFTKEIFSIPQIQKEIQERNLKIQGFSTKLKGFSESSELFRIKVIS